MKAKRILSLIAAGAFGCAATQAQVSTDIFDVTQGVQVTGWSDVYPGWNIAAILGFNGQSTFDQTWTYFSDWQPPGFVHFIEWQTPADVTLGKIKLYAFGDDFLNNSREFSRFTLKAKSVESTEYDITVFTYDASHPYIFASPDDALLIDTLVTPVTAHEFRAEFEQYTAGFGFDGPRIVELDGFPVPTPEITKQPESVTVNHGMPALFTAEASWPTPVTYQWYKDGAPIAGSTTATLRIAAATAADMGVYTVGVTGDSGTTISQPASLSINFFEPVESNADLWDVRSGAIVTATSELHPAAGTAAGMFGGIDFGTPESWFTYFADNQPTGTVHTVEWTIPNPATVRAIRLFAYGDSFLNNGREFEKVTITAKSPGSQTYDLVVGTFSQSHPYTFLAEGLVLDTEVPPVQATAFKAEFAQFTAGYGFDGPRIVELDAFETRPLLRPIVITQPESRNVPKNASVKFQVLARGGNLTYQWKFKGQNIKGATSPTYTLKHAKAFDQGYYSVVVSNEVGSVESIQALLLLTPK